MNTRVEIASGRLRGVFDRGTVVFRGIPYARPPVHEHAFRAPEPPLPWSGVRMATDFGSAAPQFVPPMRIVRGLIGVPIERQSQDCLTLNVWTPAGDSERRPVMVWIHGGAFVMGTGATFLYHGARLARRGDVVVVTINYRLGALGFLNHPELRARGLDANLGLRDQVRALEWVRENIAAFGGDPANVTIFGESAGGMSVGTLLAAPAARGLFHRAILQSGALHHVANEEQAAQVAERFLAALGLTPEDAAGVRYARTGEIQRAQQIVAMQTGIGGALMPWQPSVDGDFLPRTALEALDRGEVARVPTLVGSNRDEWRLFTLFDPRSRGLAEAGLHRRLARQLGGEAEADALLEVYRAAQRGRRSPARLWEAVQGDRVFHHPAQRAADGLAELGIPVWRYLFSWRPPLIGSRIGSGHGMELPFVFGTLRDGILRRTLGASRSAQRLSRRMRDAWIAFARDGEPGHARLPHWPGYDAKERATLEFDRESALIHAPFAAESEFWRPRLG
jgi:para-nitrobenzyl esterase